MDAAAVLRVAITGNLRSRQWRAGHRLPNRREWSETYGIGRSSVRRVLQDFKRHGLITQTVGGCTRVADKVRVMQPGDTLQFWGWQPGHPALAGRGAPVI